MAFMNFYVESLNKSDNTILHNMDDAAFELLHKYQQIQFFKKTIQIENTFRIADHNTGSLYMSTNAIVPTWLANLLLYRTTEERIIQELDKFPDNVLQLCSSIFRLGGLEALVLYLQGKIDVK